MPSSLKIRTGVDAVVAYLEQHSDLAAQPGYGAE